MESPADFPDQSITRMLKMYAQGDRRHEHEIGNYFFETLRERVLKRLRGEVLSFIDLDERTVAALRSVLSDIEHNRIRVRNRHGIQKLIVNKLYDKIADAYRKETAQKRTRRRESTLDVARIPDARGNKCVEVEAIDNLSRIIADFILEQTDVIDCFLCQSWMMHGLKSREIHSHLKDMFDPRYHRSLRTIQIRIKELKQKFKKRLEGD
jgi:hypothetical protein